MARVRKSIEGWDWWKTPAKPKPAPPIAMDCLDHDDLTPFSFAEQTDIRRWRSFGRPNVASEDELNDFIAQVRYYQEWHFH